MDMSAADEIFRTSKPKLYDFYSTPDSENCLAKLWNYTKYSACAGVIFSFYEMVFNSKPKTFEVGAARFARFTLPFDRTHVVCWNRILHVLLCENPKKITGAGATFGAATCICAQLRGKDDVANHVVGSFAAGSIFGFKYNKVAVGFQMGLVIVCFASYVKLMRMKKIPMFQQENPLDRINYPRIDLSIKFYEDPGRPKNY